MDFWVPNRPVKALVMKACVVGTLHFSDPKKHLKYFSNYFVVMVLLWSRQPTMNCIFGERKES